MPKKIAIIGGGFAGTMVIRQLIDHGFKGEITRFHHSDSETLGPAYRADSGDLLLNVRSQNMSAFPDDPEHFLRFLQNELPEFSNPRAFVQRSIYGSYLTAIWTETKTRAEQRGIPIILKETESPRFEEFDVLVLATGNELPRIPKELSKTVYESRFYQGNPWGIEFSVIRPDLPIFILGNGLTMVDTVLRLRSAGFQQKIIALSTHGFNMLAHPEEEVYSASIQPKQIDLVSLVHFFNQQRKVLTEGQFLLSIDALRPQFTHWWQGFSLQEKKIFLSRFRHFWGIIRHRIPADIAEVIRKERRSGQLEVRAGKIVSAELKEGHLSIQFQSGKNVIQDDFACFINCTGPETSIEKMSNPVIQELLDRKWILPDTSSQGIQIQTVSLRVIGPASLPIYAIGNLCKGTLWESTAIGELRSQAKLIAKGILGDN
jgi:uncharacterized NAD(P)/FAD-binding protein YdhS